MGMKVKNVVSDGSRNKISLWINQRIITIWKRGIQLNWKKDDLEDEDRVNNSFLYMNMNNQNENEANTQ
jgi:hypothetical protein